MPVTSLLAAALLAAHEPTIPEEALALQALYEAAGGIGANVDFPKYFEKYDRLVRKEKFPEIYHTCDKILPRVLFPIILCSLSPRGAR